MNHDIPSGVAVSDASRSDERLTINVPGELAMRLDEVIDLLGFRSREEFALIALKQHLDKYSTLMKWVVL